MYVSVKVRSYNYFSLRVLTHPSNDIKISKHSVVNVRRFSDISVFESSFYDHLKVYINTAHRVSSETQASYTLETVMFIERQKKVSKV